jgi:hypothetical protein
MIQLMCGRYEIEGCEVIWAIKDDAITHTFIDTGAAQFFAPTLNRKKDRKQQIVKRAKYRIAGVEFPSKFDDISYIHFSR